MSVIGNTSQAPAVSLKNMGDSIAGRIVSFEDYQVVDWQTKEPKFFPKSGDPILGVRIVLETNPGDTASQQTLYAEKVNMLKAIASAVKGAGAADLEVGGDLAVTFSGMDGRAKAFMAAYDRPESAEAAKAA
jgi:hypothetical protein